jgi:hypothetical protein
VHKYQLRLSVLIPSSVGDSFPALRRRPTSEGYQSPPAITINGDNPAIIHVGDTYADLGATITSPQADLNLGIKTFLNGTLVSNIVIDTSSEATNTIDYVATDSAGLTSTTRQPSLIKHQGQSQHPSLISPRRHLEQSTRLVLIMKA